MDVKTYAKPVSSNTMYMNYHTNTLTKYVVLIRLVPNLMSDTILKVDNLMIITTYYGWNRLSGFREDFLNSFCQKGERMGQEKFGHLPYSDPLIS